MATIYDNLKNLLSTKKQYKKKKKKEIKKILTNNLNMLI